MFGIFHNKKLENNTYYVPGTKLAQTYLSYKLTLQKNSQNFFFMTCTCGKREKFGGNAFNSPLI